MGIRAVFLILEDEVCPSPLYTMFTVGLPYNFYYVEIISSYSQYFHCFHPERVLSSSSAEMMVFPFHYVNVVY